jgi:hypothetical protein
MNRVYLKYLISLQFLLSAGCGVIEANLDRSENNKNATPDGPEVITEPIDENPKLCLANIDFNKDGIVNYADLAILVAGIGKPISNLAYNADLNCDDKVDDLDQTIFQQAFGKTCSISADFNNDGYITASIDLFYLRQGLETQSGPGDLNCDGKVDDIDVKRFTQALSSGGMTSADLNNDGISDEADLELFLNLYNTKNRLSDVNRDGIVDYADYLAFQALMTI